MGVPGMIGILKRSNWCTSVQLKDDKLVIDATDGMYWFVKTKLIDRSRPHMDKFGMSIRLYSNFMRSFFSRLQKQNVTPIVVYNGARLEEQIHGALLSKKKHLMKSSQIRMYKMNKRGPSRLDDTILPAIATNALKQIVNELNIKAYQSTYEVYPLLIRLAAENDCPVLTSHSDFILANVRRGFILAELFDEEQLMTAHLFKHSNMLTDKNLHSYSSALYCLNALLRPDFSGKYFTELNHMFKLPLSLKFQRDNIEFVYGRPPPRQPCSRRLGYILDNWPNNLTNRDSVRRAFRGLVRNSEEAMRDYDNLFQSFTDSNYEYISSLVDHGKFKMPIDLVETFTKREASASFVMDILMSQTNFDRGTIEDLQTFRSAYSLQDPVKKLLMNLIDSKALNIYDRQQSTLGHRSLAFQNFDLQARITDQILFKLFNFPEEISNQDKLRVFIEKHMKIAPAFQDKKYCEQLIVLLMLARFSFGIGLRNDHINEPAQREIIGASSADKSKVSAKERCEAVTLNEEKYSNYKMHFFNAIYNDFMNQAFIHKLMFERMEEHPSLQDKDGGFYSDVSLAASEIEGERMRFGIDTSNPNYLEIKHMIEMLNSSLHAYIELNALANYPGPKFQLGRFYDAMQIYKICRLGLIGKPRNNNLLKIEFDVRVCNLLE